MNSSASHKIGCYIKSGLRLVSNQNPTHTNGSRIFAHHLNILISSYCCSQLEDPLHYAQATSRQLKQIYTF